MFRLFRKLEVRLVLGFIMVLLIPASITTFYIIGSSRESTINSARDSILEATSTSGLLLETLLQNNIADTLILAQAPEIRNFQQSRDRLNPRSTEHQVMADMLDRFINRYEDRYKEVTLLNTRGQETFKIQRNQENSTHDPDLGNKAARNYFQMAMGISAMPDLQMPVFVSSAYNDILFSTPIRMPDGSITGVLTLKTDLGHYYRVLKHHSPNLRFQLIDKNGRQLFEQNQAGKFPSIKNIGDFISSNSDTQKGTLFKTPYNPDTLLGFTRIHPDGQNFIQWTLMVERPVDAILSQLSRTQSVILLTTGMSLLAALLIAFILTRSITRPIRLLSNAANNLRKEELGQPIAIDASIEEINDLTGALNRMSTDLASTYKNLDDKVSALKSSQRSLQESEKRYRNLIDTANDLVFVNDFFGNFIDVNQYACDRLGYSRDELLNMSIRDFEVEDDQDKDSSEISHILQHNGNLFESKYRTSNGDIFSCEVNATLMRYEGETVILALVRDVSQRKYVQAALEEERERLNITLRSIRDGVITTNTYGEVVMMNQAAEKITGHFQSETIGKPLDSILSLVDEKKRQPVAQLFEKYSVGEGSLGKSNNALILTTKDGEERIITESGSPIFRDGNLLEGVVVVFRDVTDSRRLEEQMHQSQKVESLSVLAGGIAHDFNNLLGVIVGNVSLAQLECMQGGTEIGTYLEESLKASNRAKELTQQLLTFAKGGTLIKKVASVEEIVKEAVQFTLHGSNVRCTYINPETLWNAEVDAGQVTQVVNNLVINAIQAMPQGGDLFITLENRNLVRADKIPVPEGSYLHIGVRDTGIGIPKDYLTKVFDPYFTTKETGNGLGLASCYTIIKNHGGLLDVESVEGKGTEFHIYLPANVSGTCQQQATAREPVHGSGRVLLMDDDESIRNTSANILHSLGYKTVTVLNGPEAIEVYQKAIDRVDPFDAVVMDLTVPGGMGAQETMKRILEIDPEATGIVTSGYNNSPVVSSYRNYGFKAALTKPFDIVEFSIILSDLIHPDKEQPLKAIDVEKHHIKAS